MGDSENHMEIFHREYFFYPVVKPLKLFEILAFWTVPVSAGIVRYFTISAGVAIEFMPPESCCPAAGNGFYNLPLLRTKL